MPSQFNLPDWLSPQQETVLKMFLGSPGTYVSTEDFCQALYNEKREKGPAPAKLRVLIQRCRDIVSEITKGKVDVTIRRNSGWKISRKDVLLFKRYLANL